jgi:hypothetical protein
MKNEALTTFSLHPEHDSIIVSDCEARSVQATR